MDLLHPKANILRTIAMNKLLVVFLIFSVQLASAQKEAPNKTDAEGRKQGLWIKRYENDTLQYKGTFKNDKPIGTLERFYEDGSLQALIMYEGAGEAEAKIYYPEDSALMAQGNYLNEKRDSTWLFYTPDGNLASKENYIEGKKHGLTTIYFADGSISEKIHFENGIKNGPWEQFFEDGQPKLKTTVKEGIQFEGEYISYYPDGTKLLKGSFLEGRKHSSWYHFNEDGSIRLIEVYRAGKVQEEHLKNGVFEDYWPDDIKKSEYTYKNGEKHGPFKEYYNKGEWRTEEVPDELGGKRKVQRLYETQVMREGKYRAGKLHGTVTTYKENGKVDKVVEYEMGEKVK